MYLQQTLKHDYQTKQKIEFPYNIVVGLGIANSLILECPEKAGILATEIKSPD